MGNYTAQQHMDLFGGLPEREHGPHHLGASDSKTPAGDGSKQPSVTPAGTSSAADGHCDVCGAPVGKHHLSYCDLRGDV